MGWIKKTFGWVKAFATKPENVKLIPGIHMVGGEN